MMNQDEKLECTKCEYAAPRIFVKEIKMKDGIAPAVVNGSTVSVSTGWGWSDTATIDIPF